MKKIGHLTFHASHNYGSVLQSYALTKQLQLMGNEVETINLRPDSQKATYKIIKPTEKIIYKLFKLCLCTFCTTPSIDIKIIIDVEPALINGRGKPVGGTRPVTTAMLSKT